MNSFRLSVILVILSLSSVAQSQSHDEYIIEVIVFEQLEIIDNEQLEPKDLNLKDINAVALLDSPEIILNEKTILKSFDFDDIQHHSTMQHQHHHSHQ